MHNYVMFVNRITAEAVREINSIDKVIKQIVADIRHKDVELLTLVANEPLDVVTLSVYESVIEEIKKEGVLVEGYVEGKINLATLDLFSTTLVDEFRMSPTTLMTLDKMWDEWTPKNHTSSLLWNLGNNIELKSAEDVSEVYRDAAMNDVIRLTLDERFLTRIDGYNVHALSHNNGGWRMTSLSEVVAA